MATRTEKMATETEWKTARSRPVELIVPAKVEEEKKMKKIEIFWKDHESESESESKKTTTNSSSSGPTITKTSGSKSDSESLRRLDSKSGSGYDSAGNKTTPNKVALRLGRVSYRSSLISRKRFSIGKPGSKKRQRWLNQLELGRDKEALFDTGSYEAWRIFFAEQKDSPLKMIFENPALRALWKEFLDVTEEEQERMFQKLGLSSRYDLDEADVPQDPRDDDDENGGDEISTDPDWRSVDADSPFDYQSLFLEDPELSFKRVDKSVRKVARKMGHDSLLMRAIDHSILSFLSMEMHRPEIPFFSDSFSFLLPEVFDKINQRLIVRSDDRAILQLILPEPFDRLITHNACKYYGLRSQSFEDEGGESCVLIGPLDEVQFPRKSLTRYLFSHNPSDPDSLYWSTPSSSSFASSSRKRSKKRSKSTSHKQTDSRTAKALERRQKLVAEGGML